jgi:hypothetical protein
MDDEFTHARDRHLGDLTVVQERNQHLRVLCERLESSLG